MQHRDSAAACLALVARLRGRPLDEAAVQRAFEGAEDIGGEGALDELLLVARRLALKARKARLAGVDELMNKALPVIARNHQGEWFVIARARERAGEKQFLVQCYGGQAPLSLGREELEASWTGEVLLVGAEAGMFAGLTGQLNIAWFTRAMAKYRRVFVEVLVASFFLQLVALATPLYFQVVMDKVLSHGAFTTLNVVTLAICVMLLFEAFVGGMRNYLFSHTANRVDVELGARLFDHLLRLPVSYFENRQTGHTVARVRELESIREFITGTALTLLIDLLFFFVFIAVLWHYSPSLTAIVLLSVPIYILLSVAITPRIRQRLDEKFEAGADSSAFLTEAVSGMGTIKSQALERQTDGRWQRLLARYVRASFRAANINNIASQSAGLVSKLTTVAIIWWGVHLVLAGAMTVGQLVAFNMIAGRVSAPILKLVQLWQDFQQAGISMRRLGDILNCPAEDCDDGRRPGLPAPKGSLSLQGVRFRYAPESPLVLQDICLQISPGEVIGVVGHSGSGKSTLSKLLQRLYTPEAGKLSFDGIDVSLLDRHWLRRQVGVVEQDNFLFKGTVRDNIAIANPALPLSGIVECARMAGAHEFILDLPRGYDTELVEQGRNLSGGQRQRLAIARALLSNPRVLIFDEATSALDYESERVLHDNMRAICAGRTVLIIAHRLSAVRQCNRIAVLEKGRIVECGSHEQLLRNEGYYAGLYRYQRQEPTPLSMTPAIAGGSRQGAA